MGYQFLMSYLIFSVASFAFELASVVLQYKTSQTAASSVSFSTAYGRTWAGILEHFLAINKETTLRKEHAAMQDFGAAGYICFLLLLSFDLLYSDFVCLRYMSLFTILS